MNIKDIELLENRVKILEEDIAKNKNELIQAKTSSEIAKKNIEELREELKEFNIEDCSNEGIKKYLAELATKIETNINESNKLLDKIS